MRLANQIAAHKKFKATTEYPGVVLKAEPQADLAAGATLADAIAAHNALLAKLRAAGLMA